MWDWTQLPDDILKLIASKLNSIEDYIKFGGVCHSWHSIYIQKDCSSLPKLPWLMLVEKKYNNMRGFYSPFSSKVHEIYLRKAHGKRCWGSPHGWLVTLGADMNIHLLNPLSSVQIPLPPLHKCPNLNKLICSPRMFRDMFVQKVVLSSSPYSSDCVVMAIYSNSSKLAYVKPGDEAWTPLECPAGRIDDIVYINGNILAVNDSRDVLICNSFGSVLNAFTFLPSSTMEEPEYEFKYLVECGGNIYMVMRHLYDADIIDIGYTYTCDFVVYKLDLSALKAEKVESLENWSFFVGNNSSFSICTSEYPECMKNCIYFTSDFGPDSCAYDMGIYSFEDQKIKSFRVAYGSLSVFSLPLWIKPSMW